MGEGCEARTPKRTTAPPGSVRPRRSCRWGKMSTFPKVGLKSIHRGTAEEIVEAFITDSRAIGARIAWDGTKLRAGGLCPGRITAVQGAYREVAANAEQRQPHVILAKGEGCDRCIA